METRWRGRKKRRRKKKMSHTRGFRKFPAQVRVLCKLLFGPTFCKF